jgi:precorrin-4/cobalt-precorrin-4 C11-methyltransferase
MTVHFIGAGPGAADLLTVRAQRIIDAAAVVLYAGALVPQEVLASCRGDAKLVDTADLTLDQIMAELEKAHAAGQDVARLHSGDPSVFSAVGEQMRRLDALGIDYDVVPGVPAFAAAAAALKRELTLPAVGQTVILTRTSNRSTPMPPGEDLASLGRTGATLVLHLSVQHTERLVEELTPSYGPDCPVAVVAYASRPDEIILRGSLSDIAAKVAESGVKRTAVVIVGKVLGDPHFCDSHLYSPERIRGTTG